MTSDNRRVRRAPLLSGVIAMVLGGLVLPVVSPLAPVPVAHAAGEVIISTFYVPIFEDNAREALFSVNGTTGLNLSSTTSVTVGAEGAIIYYDHWEDGYEPTPNDRIQSSTLVLGDGDLTNGNAATYCVPARCAGDYLPAGAVLRLNNSATIVPGVIVTPRVASTVVFDGRDKLSATEGLAVTHATWPTAIDALHSEMAAAFDTSRWGVNFSSPVGTDTPNVGSNNTFSYTGMEIMASEPGTQLFVDFANNGNFTDPGDINGSTVIGEGETYYIDGTVLEGTRVVASKPVQVFLMTGVIGSNYENRSFQIFPTEGLVNDYVAPASTARPDGTYATVLYLYNPQSTTLNITVTTPSGSTVYAVPAGQTYSPAPTLAYNEAARITAAQTFAVVAGSGAAEGGSRNYDWGYSPLPSRLLVDDLVVGWAPGSQDLSAPDYDPVWATAVAPTVLYIDYDADPTTGANVDANGSRYDTTVTIANALDMVRITDPNDNDMTGTRIYTIDDVGISLAYGEDPDINTPVAQPGIDLGTTQFPACGALCVRKEAAIAIDVDGDGLVDPGDTITWVVTATNTDYYALVFPVLLDILPPDVSYLPGTSSVQLNNDPVIPIADDVVPPAATLFPWDELGREIVATLPVGSQVTVTFDTIVDPDYSSGNALCNRALVTSDREIILTDANGADTGCVPVDGLRVTKTSDTGGQPVVPGQTIEYTIGVDNQSSGTLTNIAVIDPLPAGLTWVSTDVVRPTVVNNTVADDFEVSGDWTGSTGTVAWTDSAWTETDGGGLGTGAGRIRKVTDAGDLSLQFRNGSQANEGVARLIGNLSAYSTVGVAFDRRCVSLESGDAVSVQVRPDGSSAWDTIATFNNCDNGSYIAESIPLSAAQFGSATSIRFIVTDAFGGGGTDNIYFDNLVISATGRFPVATAGAAPPNLFTLTDLLVGESATVTLTVTVNNPYTATDEIANIVTVRSGNTVAQASVVDCVRCFDYGDNPVSYEDAGPAPARARATSERQYIADTFQALGYTGNTGSVDWAGIWTEVDALGGGATSGRVQNIADAGTRSLRIGDTGATTAVNQAATRAVGDLSGASTVTLSYDYRCLNMGATDTVQVQIRPTNAAAWQVVQTINSCNNPTIYSNNAVTLAPALYGATTELRVIVTSALEANELFFFDDVQFRVTYDSRTVGPRLGTLFDREVGGAGTNPPFPATAPAAPNGDDLDGVDDEDGVTVPAVDTETLVLPIVITDSTGGSSYLNGWFDWNGDGLFQSSESIFAPGTFVSATGGITVSGGAGSVPGPGSYSVTITVPDLEPGGYEIGDTMYSRFRVATELTGVSVSTGPALDGEIEDYATTLNTLPVNLAYFSSARSGRQVTVDWRTSQEVDNLGFHVYAEKADGTLQQLTTRIVPAVSPTSVTPQDYRVRVRTNRNVLWLEDISLDGVRELHGPYRVGGSFGDPESTDGADWADVQAEVEAAEGERHDAAREAVEQRLDTVGPTTSAGPVARLEVTESGIHVVTFEQLLSAGVDLTGVATDTFALTDASGPVPIEIVGGPTFGPGSSFRFVGEPVDSLYTGTNVYRLHLDRTMAARVAPAVETPGEPAPPKDSNGRPRRTTSEGGPVIGATEYTAVVRNEVNVEYSVTAPGDDPWYEQLLLTFSGSPSTASTTVSLDAVVPGASATVSVDLWGITRDPIVDDHHVALRVNGQQVQTLRFDDNEAVTLSAVVAPGVLVEGDNLIEVVSLADTGAYIDMIVIDGWQVEYRRGTVATDGRLDLSADAPAFDVSALPSGDVVAYRIAADGVVSLASTAALGGGVVQVSAAGTGARYVVSAATALHSPVVAAAPVPADLLGGSADYLMVTHGMFTDTLAALVAHHESIGRTVKVVDVADVYEAYNHGVVDASAIDRYLAEAVPALGLTWVLLVGADSYDYRDYYGIGAVSLLPSLYGSTGYNISYAPLDPAFADVDGDKLPDVALGRMPAHTSAELQVMIDKTIAYAANPSGDTALLVSDAGNGLDYAAANDALQAQLAAWDVARVDIDRQGLSTAQSELLAAFADGPALTVYLGHSSSQEWTELGLFTTSDAQALVGPSTALLQFGCWNTYYVAPDSGTLAHALLLNPDGGAVVVGGSTALVSSANDIAFSAFLAAAIEAGAPTIGEAIQIAKRELARHAGGSVDDVLLGWTVLGDPAVAIGGNG